MNKKIIYLDYGATTPLFKEVYTEMEPYIMKYYGNGSSVYSFSEESKMAIDLAREKVADAINCKKSEVFFTSGGTESDNWAIKGAAFANKKKGKHIITTQIEHPAVLKTCEYLETVGFEVTYLPVDKYGIVDIDKFKASIKADTILVSIMYANNEIGSIQPIKEIGKILKEKDIIFHSDGFQAAGHVNIDVEEQYIDLLSISAHKFHGPKGIGALYIRKGVKIENFMHGGSQERSKRAGTENAPAIVGLGKAIELSKLNMKEEEQKLESYRRKLIDGLLTIPNAWLNGPDPSMIKRLPGNVNVTFQGIDAEIILMHLDLKGICISVGSACSAGAMEPSHVLLALGLDKNLAKSSIRISMGFETTEEEVDFTIEAIKEVVNKIRNK